MKKINEAIIYIENLLEKYKKKIANNVYENLVNKLNYIKEKSIDSKLYLSIIGEFSSGKSTLINALLRDDLLESHVLQGTTTVNTIIEYYNNLSVSIHKRNGIIEVYSEKKFEKELIREKIKSIQHSNFTSKIEKMVIKYPSDFLKQKIAIVDTPGINSLEKWHESVTEYAIRDFTDACIILISANQPLPMSLIDFVNDKLHKYLKRCIFVVSKIDTISEMERDEMISYIKHTIQQKLKINNPLVLPYSQLLVLNEKTKNLSSCQKSNQKSILELSYLSEKQLIEFLNENMVFIKNEKISQLIYDLLIEIECQLDNKIDSYTKHNDLLKNNKKMDINEFKKIFIEEYVIKLNIEMEKEVNNALTDIKRKFEQDIVDIHDHLFNCQTEEEVYNFSNIVNSNLLDRKDKSEKYIENILLLYINKVNKLIDHFLIEINKKYDGLNVLLNKRLENNVIDLKKDLFSKIKITIPQAKDSVKTGGSVIGATIGGLIFPGVGLLLGGLLGHFVGSVLESNLQKIKNQIWEYNRSNIINQLNNLYNNIKEILLENFNKINYFLNDQIRWYIKEYQSRVAYLIKKDEEKCEILKRKIVSTNKDKLNIKVIKDILKTI